MSEHIQGSLSPADELKAEFSRRSKSFVSETVRAKNAEALAEIVSGKEKDGWKVAEKYKESIHMQRPKRADRQLEDDIWCLLYRMGFTHLNEGSQFKIKVRSDEFRQIDVLGLDDESAVFVECTQSDEPKKKPMTTLIEKVVALRAAGSDSSLRKHCGKKLKIGWSIATRNIEWSRADLQRAREEQITPIRDLEIQYFTQLAEHLKFAARYQFLAQLFEGQNVAEMKLQVPATRAQMGGKIFYNFVIRPSELLKRSFIAHKANQSSRAGIEYYQRLISNQRLRKIANYIDDGGLFPTNIVINIRSDRPLIFDVKKKFAGASVGTLHLPSQYACAWVIDGQHRLFGYAHSKRAEKKDDNTTFPVLAFDDLPSPEEAQMFVDVNHEQKSVSTSLLKEIYATLNWESADFKLRTDALTAKLVLEFNKRPTSPLNGRIKVQGSKGSYLRCLTVQQISDPLRKGGFFGEERPNGQIIPGPLSDSNSDQLVDDFEKAYAALSQLFLFVSEQVPENWKLGNSTGGFLATNMGVRSLLGVFRDVLQYVQKKKGLSFDLYDPEEFMPDVLELIQPLVTHFRQATVGEVRAFRDQVGMAGVRRNELEMMRLIKAAVPEFTAKGLDEHIAAQDIEGTKRARELITEVNRRLHEYVIAELKQEFGNADDETWFREGVPVGVRKKCAERREEDPLRKELWAYLTLIDYHKIAGDHWTLFQDAFTLFEDDKKKRKAERIKWIEVLNGMRQITAHPEKGSLSREEVKQVRKIHTAAMEKLGGTS